jgi:transcriptional regulator with XRE-family HTH domain
MGYTDRSSIAKIESGKVDLPQSKIMEFANVFGVDPGDLMGWNDEEVLSVLFEIDHRSDNANPIDYSLFLKARKFSELYFTASPEIRSAVDILLESSQPSHEPHHSPKDNAE